MTNIFKKIYQKLFHESTEKDMDSIYDRYNENSISFILDRNNNVVIQVNVQHFDDSKYIDKFAELLFMTNNGYYQKKIADILAEMVVQDPDRALFLSSVIQKWSNYIDKYVDLEKRSNDYDLEKPCVSPLSFSKLVSQQPNIQNEK